MKFFLYDISKKMFINNKKKNAFTLVELIIVIAIIAILAAIAIPKFGEMRQTANEKADIATAKNIATIVAEGIAEGGTSASNPYIAAMTAGGSFAGAGTGNTGKRMDGDLVPKSKKNGENTVDYQYFVYTISPEGNIVVYASPDTNYNNASKKRLYPQQ